MKFVRLHYYNGGAEVYLNAFHIARIDPDRTRGGCHVFSVKTGGIHVAEDIDGIMKLLCSPE